MLQSFVAGLTFTCSDRCNDTNVYGNSDVKANDRLPILACTHESVCTKKTCVKKHALKRTTRISQRAQSVTNGYFGGYIGKRQPTGKLEVRKCMDKNATSATENCNTIPCFTSARRFWQIDDRTRNEQHVSWCS